MKNILCLFFGLLIISAFVGCEPYIEDDIEIGALPAAPDFTVEVLAANPNLVVISETSTGIVNRVWELPEAAPPTSTLKSDTILYLKAGTYPITLYANAEGGGTSSKTLTVTIEQDAQVQCSEQLELLVGGCFETSQKCWTFSQVAGAVTVGPDPGSDEWFRSAAGGLQGEQYDDSFCFSFAGTNFLYKNSGQTIDPWNGFVPVDYAPPTDHTWFISPGAGANGEDQIILTDDSFMGVWDSGPKYDIVLLTEDELVVRSKIVEVDGWFELYFVAL